MPMLLALIRRLVTLEVCRMLRPHCAEIGSKYAETWLQVVALRGGSQRLSGVVYRGALRKLHRLYHGFSCPVAANDNAFPIDPELLQKCDNDRDLAIEQMECDEMPGEWRSPPQVAR